MTFKILKILSAAAALSFVSLSSALAATIENKDAEAQTISMTEDGVKNELVIGAGETVTACANGCFITLPNGDRTVLAGDENVQIVSGAAVIN